MSFRGREIRAGDVAFLGELIAQNPTLSRRALSAKVCEAWNWVQPNGQLRDMICRSLMLKLHRAGHIAIHLMESFVDIERFQGTCYRAANWRCLGRSLGRGTKSKHDAPDTSVKELWAYPLSKRLREKLVAH